MLHQFIALYLEAFLGAVAEAGDGAGLPQFIGREFREFLTCGVFEGGGWRGALSMRGLRPRAAGAVFLEGARVVSESGGRRMMERAAHLVDAVLPRVPVR